MEEDEALGSETKTFLWRNFPQLLYTPPGVRVRDLVIEVSPRVMGVLLTRTCCGGMRSRAILVWKIVGPLWVRAALGIKGIARIPDEVFLDTDGVTRFPSTYPCGLTQNEFSYTSAKN